MILSKGLKAAFLKNKKALTIGVYGAIEKEQWKTLQSLGGALSIHFQRGDFSSVDKYDASILLNVGRRVIENSCSIGKPRFISLRAEDTLPCATSPSIKFSDNPDLLDVFSGREIQTNEALTVKGLPNWCGVDSYLALKGGVVVWGARKIGIYHEHYVSFEIPGLCRGETLFDHFNSKKFFKLLPLILYLMALKEDDDWIVPSLKACFMFDDPNLHWPTYGHIDFERLAHHARRHGYHVSFATIPLDAWFVHKRTASIFRRNRDTLSLLVHGIDHTKCELAWFQSKTECRRRLKQAISRLKVLERRSGIQIARVMAPPHGACSEETMNVMANLGFEGLCISKGSLLQYNKGKTWNDAVGVRAFNIIRGLPVIPRFRLSRTCHNSVLLAALLREPIILVGHHYDLVDGLGLLEDLSRFVNSIGHIDWMSLKDIARSQYAIKVREPDMHIKMFSNRIRIKIPARVCRIKVKAPLGAHENSEALVWRPVMRESSWKPLGDNQSMTVSPGETIEISLAAERKSFANGGRRWGIRVGALMRRLLTETRDRIHPILY